MRPIRLLALGLGASVLAWQGGNALQGRFLHPFLVSDIAMSLVLVVGGLWPGERGAAAVMLGGFAALGGIFLSATTGRLLLGGYRDPGTVLTTLGIVPCLAAAVALGRRLARPGP